MMQSFTQANDMNAHTLQWVCVCEFLWLGWRGGMWTALSMCMHLWEREGSERERWRSRVGEGGREGDSECRGREPERATKEERAREREREHKQVTEMVCVLESTSVYLTLGGCVVAWVFLWEGWEALSLSVFWLSVRLQAADWTNH